MKTGDVVVSNLGGKQHRAVCVGISPDGYIALVLATSKIKEVKKRASYRTNLRSITSITEIKKEEYQSNKNPTECSLTKDTCFDCNEILTIHKNGPIKTATPCDPLPKNLLNKIKQAIQQSPEVEEYQKERFNL